MPERKPRKNLFARRESAKRRRRPRASTCFANLIRERYPTRVQQRVDFAPRQETVQIAEALDRSLSSTSSDCTCRGTTTDQRRSTSSKGQALRQWSISLRSDRLTMLPASVSDTGTWAYAWGASVPPGTKKKKNTPVVDAHAEKSLNPPKKKKSYRCTQSTEHSLARWNDEHH